MKFYLKNQFTFWQLGLGLFWLIYSVYGLANKFNHVWIYYVFLAISIFYLLRFLDETVNGYVSIKDGKIRVSDFPLSKSIPINQITEIHKFAGDYVLKSPNKNLTINTQNLKPNSLKELNEALDKLNLKWS